MESYGVAYLYLLMFVRLRSKSIYVVNRKRACTKKQTVRSELELGFDWVFDTVRDVDGWLS